MPLGSPIIVALALLVAPLAAASQELPGLDLSRPEQPPAEDDAARRPPEAPPPPAPAPGRAAADTAEDAPTEAPGLDLADEPRPAAAPRVLGPAGERDAALGDRVKAVQRKGFLKRGRWEIGASFPVTVNDAFYQKLGAGGRVAYHLHDSFALRLRGDTFSSIRTGRAREGKIAFSSQLLSSQLDRQLLLDGVWSPVYGKVSVLGGRIVHFDLFLLAGLGLAWSDTSASPRSLGPHLATELGGGIRFYPADWLALEAGLGATLYPDQPVASVPSTLQKVVAASVGFSIFLPFRFQYRHP
jgi:outer membrane beta-barrel protein